MVQRPLGNTGAMVSPIGFGAFKIGRNVGTKYEREYELPDEQAVQSLLNGVLDLGINLIDTAPAYGVSEERIGRAIAHRREEYILATKVGEVFENNRSQFDFSSGAARLSVDRSRARLRTDVVDIVSIHSSGDDLGIIGGSDCVETLCNLRDEGAIRWIGFSGKTVQGTRAALGFADVVMVEYHLHDQSHSEVIAEAHRAGKAVLIKKGLASGRLNPEEAIRFILSNTGVSSMVVGSLSMANMQRNLHIAQAATV